VLSIIGNLEKNLLLKMNHGTIHTDIQMSGFSTITFTITRRQGRMKYHILTQSGRDFIMDTDKDVYTIAYEAYEEACLMDDYLVNITPICDV